MNRKLIDYIPTIIRDYRELQLLMKSQQPEFDLIWDAMDRFLSNQFIDTMDDAGLSRWEKILKITPNPTETLDTRRARIKVYLNRVLPYVYKVLLQKIETISQGLPYTVDLTDYLLTITAEWDKDGQIEALEEVLDYMLPANIAVSAKNNMNYSINSGLFNASAVTVCEYINISDAGDSTFTSSGNICIAAGLTGLVHVDLSDAGDHTITVNGDTVLSGAITNLEMIELSDAGTDALNIDGNAVVKGAATVLESVNLSDAGNSTLTVDSTLAAPAEAVTVEIINLSDTTN